MFKLPVTELTTMQRAIFNLTMRTQVHLEIQFMPHASITEITVQRLFSFT